MSKCSKCGKEKPEDEYKTCPECRAKANLAYAEKKAQQQKQFEEAVKEAKFQIDLREKEARENEVKAQKNAKFAEANRFLNVDDIPLLTIKECTNYRYMMLNAKPKMPHFERHLATCQSCTDWQWRLDNGSLSANDNGEIYIPNKQKLAGLSPFGVDKEVCKQFREQYAGVVPRSEDFALFYDQHLPFCDQCKKWLEAYNKQQQFEPDLSTMGENKAGMVAICSNCGSPLDKKGKCPNCNKTQESQAVQYQRELSQQEEPKQEQQPEPQQQPQPQRKKFDSDEWLRNHSN